MKHIVTLILLSVLQVSSFATTYTSSGNKTWSASSFPSTLGQNDTIIITNSNTVTFSSDIEINGVLQINTGSTLRGTKEIQIETTGKIIVTTQSRK